MKYKHLFFFSKKRKNKIAKIFFFSSLPFPPSLTSKWDENNDSTKFCVKTSKLEKKVIIITTIII